MSKNQQLDLWLKAKRGRLVRLAAQMNVSKQYLSELRRLKAGISDKRWNEILEAMGKVGV